MNRRGLAGAVQRSRLAALALAAVGCASAAHPPPAVSRSSSASGPGTDGVCAQGQFGREQFLGDWTEPGESVLRTLATDGTLKQRIGDSDEASGTWSFQPWALTPAKRFMPDGEANQCVLWLHLAAPSPVDLAYVPLTASSTTLQLTYIGRGNTITWLRPNADT